MSLTQEDPIGLAGGMNLYGYAAGDPVNNSDPFGLDPFVQCRPIDGGPGKLGFHHCGVRVVDPARNLDVVIELMPVERGGAKWNEYQWSSADGPSAAQEARSKYNVAGWKQIARPDGMSEAEFDNAILNAAAVETRDGRGKQYSNSGDKNSNSFVYRTVKRAGGRVPKAAVQGKEAPGACGGKHSTGTDCSPD